MERTRRELLGVGAALAATAGCLAPTGDGGRVGVDEPFEPAEGSEPVRVDDGAGYEEVYETVSPSVARIQTYAEDQPAGLFDEEGGGGEASQGTGFRIGEDHLVTNDHVLDEADTIRVQDADGQWIDARIVGRDPYSDLAVIETDRSLPGGALPIAESIPAIGSEVLVVGSPLGLSGTATRGIVSGRNRTLPATQAAGGFTIADAVQTDAALNPGNSGGPIVTLDGNVIGVATATRGENVGFGVSARLIREIVPSLVETGSYDHSYVGINVTPVEPLIATANDLPEASGVYVAAVAEDGPSDGVLRGATSETTVEGATVPVGGDVIIALDDTATPTNGDLSRFLALETQPGDDVDVTVYRDGSEETVTVELDPRPDPDPE